MLFSHAFSSNLTNKYNPQELSNEHMCSLYSSNLTNKYNPQEPTAGISVAFVSSNLTNKYNPQEHALVFRHLYNVQILPINTILKNNSNIIV